MAKNIRLTNDAYDEFKSFLFIVFPFMSCVSFCLSFMVDELKWFVGGLSFISFFLGICLTISTKRYRSSGAAYDGEMIVDTSDEENKKFTLEIGFNLDEVESRDSLIFKVVPSKE